MRDVAAAPRYGATRASLRAGKSDPGLNTRVPIGKMVRYGTALLAGVIAGSRGVSAVQSWQQYRTLHESDPSGADAYLTFAQVGAAIAILSLCLAALVWWLLGRGGHAPDR